MRNTMIKAMNDEALVRISGGDNGDSEIEKRLGTRLYKVGDVVEVYTNWLHIFTTRAIIDAVGLDEKGYVCYHVIYFDNKGTIDLVSADKIQR